MVLAALLTTLKQLLNLTLYKLFCDPQASCTGCDPARIQGSSTQWPMGIIHPVVTPKQTKQILEVSQFDSVIYVI